jgi:hypothetical protein
LKADYESLLLAVQQAQERERGLMDYAKELNQTVQVRPTTLSGSSVCVCV